jgi:hypothetical protein
MAVVMILIMPHLRKFLMGTGSYKNIGGSDEYVLRLSI